MRGSDNKFPRTRAPEAGGSSKIQYCLCFRESSLFQDGRCTESTHRVYQRACVVYPSSLRGVSCTDAQRTAALPATHIDAYPAARLDARLSSAGAHVAPTTDMCASVFISSLISFQSRQRPARRVARRKDPLNAILLAQSNRPCSLSHRKGCGTLTSPM